MCVDAFHDRAIRFTEIVDTIARVVDRHADGDPQQVCRWDEPAGARAVTGRAAGSQGDPGSDPQSLDVAWVLRADRWARDEARRVLGLTKELSG